MPVGVVRQLQLAQARLFLERAVVAGERQVTAAVAREQTSRDVEGGGRSRDVRGHRVQRQDRRRTRHRALEVAHRAGRLQALQRRGEKEIERERALVEDHRDRIRRHPPAARRIVLAEAQPLGVGRQGRRQELDETVGLLDVVEHRDHLGRLLEDDLLDRRRDRRGADGAPVEAHVDPQRLRRGERLEAGRHVVADLEQRSAATRRRRRRGLRVERRRRSGRVGDVRRQEDVRRVRDVGTPEIDVRTLHLAPPQVEVRVVVQAVGPRVARLPFDLPRRPLPGRPVRVPVGSAGRIDRRRQLDVHGRLVARGGRGVERLRGRRRAAERTGLAGEADHRPVAADARVEAGGIVHLGGERAQQTLEVRRVGVTLAGSASEVYVDRVGGRQAGLTVGPQGESESVQPARERALAAQRRLVALAATVAVFPSAAGRGGGDAGDGRHR